jgi:hypothetical protein
MMCKDPVTQFQCIAAVKESCEKGGLQRMRYTTPSIVFAVYQLVQRYFRPQPKKYEEDEHKSPEDSPESATPFGLAEMAQKLPLLKLYQMVYQMVDAISGAYPEIALRLFLNGVLSMNQVVKPGSETEELGYQFASQALVIYQDELTDSDSKFRAITFIIGTLQKATFFSADNYETLTTNATQYCAKLLLKHDQCKATLMCAHMFCSDLVVSFPQPHSSIERARTSRKTAQEVSLTL